MVRNSGFRDFSDIEALKIQLRELSVRQSETESQITQLDRRTETVDVPSVPPFVNFLDNSDFLYSDEAYDATTYTDDDKVLYGWFQRGQASSGAWDDPSSAPATDDAITQLSYTTGNYPSIGCYWNTSSGYLMLSPAYRVSARLPQKRGYAGNYMAVRLQLASRAQPSVTVASGSVTNNSGIQFASTDHPYLTGTKGQFTTTGTLPTGLSLSTNYWIIRNADGTFKVATSYANSQSNTAIAYTDAGSGDHTFTPVFMAPPVGLKMKVSLWDNTAEQIIEGDVLPTTTSKGGAHTGGTVRRDYIVEVHMPDGSRHYSETTTFTDTENKALNTVSCSTSDTTNFVTVSWESVVGATRYRVYRQTPAEANTNWYLIGTTSTTSLRDTGGYFGTPWVQPFPTEVYKTTPKAESYYDDIGELLQEEGDIQEVVVGFNMPSFITGTMGKQYLQIEFVLDDYTSPTLEDYSALSIDKVGLSYTNGRWCPSSNDLAVQGGEIVVNPPPSGGGGGGNPTGGGYDTCVSCDTEVLLWEGEWIRADEVVVGDLLTSYDTKTGELAPTKVKRVITGMSTGNYTLHFEDGGSLTCTFSHCVISDDWPKGTSVRNLAVGDTVKCLVSDKVEDIKIVSVERLSTCISVRSYNLDKGRRNFITRGKSVGYFNHNSKDSGGGEIVV